MRQAGLGRQDYALFARSDEGIKGLHAWLQAAGYDGMWQQRMGPNAQDSWQQWPLEKQLDRRERHVKDCVMCQKVRH